MMRLYQALLCLMRQLLHVMVLMYNCDFIQIQIAFLPFVVLLCILHLIIQISLWKDFEFHFNLVDQVTIFAWLRVDNHCMYSRVGLSGYQ